MPQDLYTLVLNYYDNLNLISPEFLRGNYWKNFPNYATDPDRSLMLSYIGTDLNEYFDEDF